jgi:serine/threonine protein kinase
MTTPAPDSDRHPIDLVAEAFAQQYRAGERPSVSDYANRHPELADQLRELLPSIAMMEKLKSNRRSSAAAVATVPHLERIGDFRIVREVGRGGMGVVYEAVQESLGRRVALKVLSTAATLDPTRLQRFDQEARAAARLHHTNIVPVFGVAEQDGLHYYVMQLIEGQALADVVRALARQGKNRTGDGEKGRTGEGASASDADSPVHPLSGSSSPPVSDSPPLRFSDSTSSRYHFRWVARIGAQVAQALHYAHQQGVLHRDVKPANLLLDGKGAVWITDFGLAKVGDDSNVTRTGDIVGTLQYLAPEALKKQADLRADIYGLGLTLHEMLTLRPPYGDPTPGELIRRIANEDPPRPRALNPAIPKDLETIVLKAVARDPDHRYQTAGELAADLDAYLQDRPIKARRASPGERLWRWCRRNRAVAALAAAAIASTLMALIVGWVGYVNTRAALAGESQRRGEAETARRAADQATLRAEQNVQLSLAAFEEIFNRVSAQEGDSTPVPPPRRSPNAPPNRQPQNQNASTVDAALLQSVLNFYDRFAEQNATNPALNLEAARAYKRVGDLYRWLDEHDKADAAYARAASMYDELLSADPARRDYARGLAESASALPFPDQDAAVDATDTATQVRRLRAASAVLDSSTRVDAGPAETRPLARALHALGAWLERDGDTAAAENAYRRANACWANAGSAPPPGGPPDRSGPPERNGPPAILDRADATMSLAKLLSRSNRDEDAQQVLKETVAAATAEMNPDGPRRPPRIPTAEPLVRLADALADVSRRLNDQATVATATQAATRFRQMPQRIGLNRPDGRGGPPPDGGPRRGPPQGRPDGFGPP